MTMIDERGRLFGRINLFDASLMFVVVLLIPIAFATFLLFRAPKPVIMSVTHATITKDERRLAPGSYMAAKLKVRGAGLAPLLRAFIDDSPALGFVFETPNSADVLVGRVAPGIHDLILYDGVQEVARAAQSVTIQAYPSAHVRAAGTLVDLDAATADALRVGAKFPPAATPRSEPQTEIVRLGPRQPDRQRLTTVTGSIVELPLSERWRIPAVMVLRCDPESSDDCTVGGLVLAARQEPRIGFVNAVQVAGPLTPMTLVVDDVFPENAASTADVIVRFAGNSDVLDLIKVGDRDSSLDDRVATVVALNQRPSENGTSARVATLRLGADPSRDGWRYRGRLVKPGAPLTLTTDRYVATGSVVGITVRESGGSVR